MNKTTRFFFLLVALGCSATFTLAEKPTDQMAKDSLQTLKILISSEIKPENRVMLIQNGKLTDSLLGIATKAKNGQRDLFEGMLADSALVQEVKTQEEFKHYWAKLEAKHGMTALKKQYAAVDMDKSRIPKKYLFDSSVVIYPGCIILRKK